MSGWSRLLRRMGPIAPPHPEPPERAWDDKGIGVEASREDRDIIAACEPHTLVSRERLWSVISAIDYVLRADVPGDVVEAGVWRGGCSLAMARALLDRRDGSRRLWLYDTFEGMTEPTAEDVEQHSGRAATDLLDPSDRASHYWAVASRSEVEARLADCGFPADRIRIVEGDVLETLPGDAPERIAVLRLDTDWYASTKWELECLFDRISPRGVLIVDDYGHFRGARQALDEFLHSRGEAYLLHRVDYTARVLVKR